jgi:hypothetical protein
MRAGRLKSRAYTDFVRISKCASQKFCLTGDSAVYNVKIREVVVEKLSVRSNCRAGHHTQDLYGQDSVVKTCDVVV